MHEQHDPLLEKAIAKRVAASYDLSTRLAVIESNYATKEYVAEVKWQLVKLFVGVYLASIAVAVAIATLVIGFTSQ